MLDNRPPGLARRDVDGSTHRVSTPTRRVTMTILLLRRYVGRSFPGLDCCVPRCCARSSRGLQGAVDGRPGHAELGGDLRHGVTPLAVVAKFVVHLPCELDLARAELGLLAAGTPAGPRRGQAVHGALGH